MGKLRKERIQEVFVESDISLQIKKEVQERLANREMTNDDWDEFFERLANRYPALIKIILDLYE